MCVCVCVCMCVCVCVCVCLRVYWAACKFVYECKRACACACVHACVFMCVRIWVRMKSSARVNRIVGNTFERCGATTKK